MYQGIPVFGGELIVQVDGANNILSANGEVLPNIPDRHRTGRHRRGPRARRRWVRSWRSIRGGASALIATRPELWIYNPVLVGPAAARPRWCGAWS